MVRVEVHAHFAGRSQMIYADFTAARELHELGLRQPILGMSEEERRRIAYHEAGHGVAGYILRPKTRVVKLAIVRHAQALGMAMYKPSEESYTRVKDDFLADIQVALAARAAEELFLGIQMDGVTGDLHVVLHVQGDERFKREGEDVLTEVPISMVKAALGGEVEVPTLEEGCTATVTIDVKPGTQPGDTLVRRDAGIPTIGRPGRGDQVVLFKVEVPTKLSARGAELLRELAAEVGETVKEPKRGLFGRSKK